MNLQEVKLNNGINIYWSRPYRAVIHLTDDTLLAGKLCGLCGNDNKIRYDDFTTPDNNLVSILYIKVICFDINLILDL